MDGQSDIISLIILRDDLLASGSRSNQIKIQDQTNGQNIKTIDGHDHFVTCFSVLQNGNLASCSYDMTIKI